MKSITVLSALFTNLSQNESTDNALLGKQLVNDSHRRNIEKYFANVLPVFTGTVGGDDYTLTGVLAGTETSATLTAAWTLNTGYQLTNFSSGEQRNVLFTNGSTGISWSVALTTAATVAISTTGQQYYNVPQNVSKIKDLTITVGQQKFVPAPILTQMDWDTINFLPYASDIPQYYFETVDPTGAPVIGIFPVPSSTGNVISYNTKRRVADMTYADYSTGTVAGTAGSTAITGSSTSWNTTATFPLNVDLTFANIFISITPPKGDGLYYQVRKFTSDSALVLVNPLVNTPLTPLTGALYTIGQYPLLEEDFHDMLVHDSLRIYFSAIKQSESQFKLFSSLYQERIKMLEDYAGTRSVNVDLGAQPNPTNPNLFIYANS